MHRSRSPYAPSLRLTGSSAFSSSLNCRDISSQSENRWNREKRSGKKPIHRRHRRHGKDGKINSHFTSFGEATAVIVIYIEQQYYGKIKLMESSQFSFLYLNVDSSLTY